MDEHTTVTWSPPVHVVGADESKLFMGKLTHCLLTTWCHLVPSVNLFEGKTVGFLRKNILKPIFPSLQKTDALRDFFRLGPAAEGLSAHLFGEAQGKWINKIVSEGMKLRFFLTWKQRQSRCRLLIELKNRIKLLAWLILVYSYKLQLLDTDTVINTVNLYKIWNVSFIPFKVFGKGRSLGGWNGSFFFF